MTNDECQMTSEIRSSNVEGRSGLRSPDSSFGFRHSFGIPHSSFGFVKSSRREFRSRHPSLDPRHFPAMSWFYRKLVRPALFSLDSEEIHNRTLNALGRL